MTAAVFQSTISINQAIGVPGDVYTNSPVISQSWILNSASAAYNIIGATGYSSTTQGTAAAGGTLPFAGILANSKVYASNGDSSGALDPTLVLPNYAQGELVTMGTMVITLPSGTVNIGDLIVMDNTTGALSSIAPGAALPSGKSFAYATVVLYTIAAGSGLTIINLQPTLIIPQLA